MSAPSSSDANILLYPAFCAAVAALAFFENGWNTAILNVPEHTIRGCSNGIESTATLSKCIRTTDALWGFVVGAHALGACFGGLAADRLQMAFGRKKTLLYNTTFWVAGSIVTALAVNVGLLIVGRIVLGIGTGIGTVVASTYINEIATRRSRGTLGCFSQLSTTVGILVSELIALALAFPIEWRILLALTSVPALLQMALLSCCPESPRQHVSDGDLQKARDVLLRLRKGYDVDQELQTIVDDHVAEKDNSDSQSSMIFLAEPNDPAVSQVMINTFSNDYGLHRVWQDSFARRRLLICLALHAGQQFTGVNVIIFFSTAIFTQQFGLANAQKISIGIAGLNVIVTLFSTVAVHRVGRKLLLCISLLGMSTFATLMVVASIKDSMVMTCIASAGFSSAFSVGLGPIPFLIIAELAPRPTISITASLSLATNWICNFALGLTFPILSKALNGYVFIIFASLSLAYAVFVWLCIPETKIARSSN